MLLGDEAAVTFGDRPAYLPSGIFAYQFFNCRICSIFCRYDRFVGLIVPHVVRMLIGTDHKKLIPVTALVGAVFWLLRMDCAVLLFPEQNYL